MKTNKERVYDYMVKYTNKFTGEDNPIFTTQFLSEKLEMQRTNVSSLLNQLVDEGKILKNNGRPVQFSLPNNYLVDTKATRLEDMIGADKTLQEVLKVIKAGILYPTPLRKIFLNVEYGVWIEDFARDIYNWAVSIKQLKLNTQFVIIDCFYYQENPSVLFEPNGLIEQSQNGMLVITNINYLSLATIHTLMNVMENYQGILMMTCSDEQSAVNELMKETLQFVGRIPQLRQFDYDERFKLLQKIICQEALRLKTSIIVNHGLLQCMMLFTRNHNQSELKNHICKAIASAYSRQGDVIIEMADLSSELRKSMLHAEMYIAQIDEVIGENYNYTFTPTKTLRFVGQQKSKVSLNEHHEKKGSTTFMFRNYLEKIQESKNREKVSEDITKLAKDFLQKAGDMFKKVYSNSLQKALSIHLYEETNNPTNYQRIDNERIMQIIDQYPNEYFFARDFIKSVEEIYHVKFLLDESVLMTLFLTTDLTPKVQSQVATLVAMHGEHVASEIAKVVKELIHFDNIYAFDMEVNEDIEKSYDRLKTCLLELDNGAGIIVIYDMGSIKVMLDSIVLDTKIAIKYLEMPLTLLAMSSSKYSQDGMNLTDLYNHLSGEYARLPYKRIKSQDNIIIVLSETSLQNDMMMNALKDMNNINEYVLIPLVSSSEADILKKVNDLAKDGHIKAIIGEKNPNLLNIHFVSSEALSEFNDADDLLAEKPDFDILEYLDQQFETISKEDFQITIIPFCDQLQNVLGKKLNEDAMIGLIVHLACLIDDLINKKSPRVNFNASSIIANNRDLIEQVKSLSQPICRCFNIKIREADIATIIDITK